MENEKGLLQFLRTHFRLPPALFVLLPTVLCILSAFPGFSEGRFAIVYYDANGPIEAGSVSLYQAFGLTGGVAQVLFYIGLVLFISIGVYGLIAAFTPKLRGAVPFFVPVLCSLSLGMTAWIWGHLLLGFRIDATTTDYFLSIEQTVQKSHALTRATLTFIVGGALPLMVWIWWIWVFILTFRSRAKAKKSPQA